MFDNIVICARCVFFGTSLREEPCKTGFEYQQRNEDCPNYIKKQEEDRHEESR